MVNSSGSDQLASFLRASDRDHLAAEVKHLLGSGGLIGDQSFESGSSLVADGTGDGTSSVGFMVDSSGSDQFASFLRASDRDHLAAEVKHLLGSGGLIGDQSFESGSSLVAAGTWGGTSSAGFMGGSGSDQLASFLSASDRDHLAAEVKHLLGSDSLFFNSASAASLNSFIHFVKPKPVIFLFSVECALRKLLQGGELLLSDCF
jgi:hypothetical protein